MMKEENLSTVEARYIELEKMKQSLELQLTEMAKRVKEANQDTLTGLRNRAGISEDINNHLLENSNGTFIIMDLDNFKNVNDTYGHVEGDATLQKVAKTLIKYSEGNEILARIGGDEFIIFIPAEKTKKDIREKATRLVKKIEREIVNPGKLSKVTTSVGIAMAPKDGESFEALYGHADIALYESKHKGKNCYSFYDEIEIPLTEPAYFGKASLAEIIHNIRETDMEGSLVVEYDSFEKIYHYIERNIARDNREVQCVLFSLEDIEDENTLAVQIRHLQNAVVSALRKGDVTTKYSESQIITLLSDVNTENAYKVIDRILEKYRLEERGMAFNVSYEVSELH